MNSFADRAGRRGNEGVEWGTVTPLLMERQKIYLKRCKGEA